MLLESEIAEEYEVHGIEVATPNGYVPVRKVYKTKPMRVWTLTVGRFTVECSHHHLVYTLLPGGFRPACSLRPDDLVMTEDGAEIVTVSADSGRVEELYDITVDRSDGMFFSNGILSHNSTTFCARQLMLACLIQGYKSLYITPYFEQLSTYGERLYEMEAQVRYDQGKQNKYLKRYPNGSKLWLSYACETADQVRGKTVGECVTGDTLVYAIEGDTTVEKRIDQLQEGDIVRTSHLDATSGMRVPATGKVQATLYKGTRKCVKVTTLGGRSVTCTPEHLFHVSGSSETWVEARNLKQGMVLHACVGGMFDLDEVDAVEQCGEYGVYDIQVADDHNFFANGILVHNCLLDECLTGDTAVYCITDDCEQPVTVALKDVKVGWKVRSFSQDTLEVSYEDVTDWACKGERHCWALYTHSGRSVTATDNHKLFTADGKKYVANIVEAFCAGFDMPDMYVYDPGTDSLVRDSLAAVEDVGTRNVYDITVNRHNTFIANDIASLNCQNMNPDLVPEILKTQQMSKAPMTIYSGTALSTDTLLEQQWQASSMGCYHVRSADGKHWINLHDEEELWKVCDNKEYPIDYWTGKRLNVTDGLFVHANSEAYAEGDIGLHIPMIVVPSNCEGTQWAQIYRDVKRQDPKKTLQENFGIAIGDGAREISKEDLQKICILSTSETELRRKVNSGFYRLIVMGCDWGGSDYNRAEKTKQSYTAVTVLGLAPDGGIDILYSHKYAGMDYTTIVGNLLKTYRDFKCNAIASDYGVGAVYTMLIRQHVPWQKHFVMQYSAPNTASFQRANSELANHYSVNKTEAVTNTFLAVKELRLRAGRWEDMDYYLTDFLACRRVPSESASGKKQFTWQRDPRKPDDYLHAVSFAMTLIKVYTGERVVADPSILSQIRNMLNGKPANHIDMAYIPPVVSG